MTGYATGLTERDNAPRRFRHRAARFGHRGPAGEASARRTRGLGWNGANASGVSRVRSFGRDPRPARAKVQTIRRRTLFIPNAGTLQSIHSRFKAIDQIFLFNMKNRIAPIATQPLDTPMHVI